MVPNRFCKMSIAGFGLILKKDDCLFRGKLNATHFQTANVLLWNLHYKGG